MKYLCVNLTKYEQDISEGNYKTLINIIKEKLKKWRITPFSRIGRLNIVNVSVFSKSIFRSNAIPIKVPASYFVNIEKKLF